MDTNQTPFEALKDAVEKAGGQSALARICGVTQPSVWKWLQSGKRLPAEQVLPVETATGVSRHDLRPDIYPRTHAPIPADAEPALDCSPLMSRHTFPRQSIRDAILDGSAAA